MANLISAKVYQIDGSPQTSAITLDFPTSNILIADCSVSTISEVNSSIQYYPNPKNLLFFQTFYVSEEIADLVAAANVGGTTQSQVGVFEINSDPFQTLSAADGGTGVQYSFPSNNISVWPSVNSTTGINSFILFKGDKYYTDSTVAEVKTTSNSGDYKVYTALLSQSTTSTDSGLLVSGKTYLILTLQAGDDFSNVGYVEEGTPFVASGTTPTVWSNDTIVINCTDSAPVATVLQNTLSGDITWTYNNVGNYTGTLSGAFTVDKTYLCNGVGYDLSSLYKLVRGGDNTLELYISDLTATSLDGQLNNTPIEIRVYN